VSTDRFTKRHLGLSPFPWKQRHRYFSDTVPVGDGSYEDFGYRRESVGLEAYAVDYLAAICPEECCKRVEMGSGDDPVTPGNATAQNEAMESAFGRIVVWMPRGGCYDVGAGDEEVDEVRQALGRIATIRIDGTYVGTTGVQQTGANTCSKSKICRVMAYSGPLEFRRRFIKQFASPIARAVVDKYDFPVRLRFDQNPKTLDQGGNGFLLVVTRDHN